MMEGLAAKGAEPKSGMIDATYLKAHCRTSSLRVKRYLGRLIGRTMGGINTKLHAVGDADGRPLSFFMTAGQISDDILAAALLHDIPKAQGYLAIAAMTPTVLGRSTGKGHPAMHPGAAITRRADQV